MIVYYTDNGEDGYEDVASLYESYADDWEEGDQHDIAVDEWSTKPVREHVNGDHCLERMIADILELELEEAGDEYGTLAAKIEERAKDPLVRMAFIRSIDLLFEGVSWWVADKVIARHQITHDADGKPLFDGKPLYVKRGADG